MEIACLVVKSKQDTRLLALKGSEFEHMHYFLVKNSERHLKKTSSLKMLSRMLDFHLHRKNAHKASDVEPQSSVVGQTKCT